MNIKKGDYVLATKFSDGDPRDHWCVGFFDSILHYKTEDRYQVVDDDGNQFRGNGFRRIKKIDPVIGAYILNNKSKITYSNKSLWWWERNRRNLTNRVVQ